MNIVSVEHVSKSYGDRTVLQDVSFGIEDQDRIGLIGINGAGKSTLLELIAKLDEPDTGVVTVGKHIVIRYVPQEPIFDSTKNMIQSVVQDEEEEYAAKDILTRLGIHDFQMPISLLSGGQRKRVALARALIHPCDLLILDEPTNHIDHETVQFLETYLQKRKGALFMVTHDRYFLDRIATRIVEIDHGLLYQYMGNYEYFLQEKIAREDSAQASEDKRQNFLRNEFEWIKRGPKARATKQKARTDRYVEILQQTPGSNSSTLEMSVASSRLGNSIMEIDHICKAYEGHTLLRDFSYLVKRRDRIGIIGLSGTGKSTLLKLLAGLVSPDDGHIKVGATVKIGYFSQDHEEIPGQVRVIEWVQESARYVTLDDGRSLSAAQMLERFQFPSAMHGTMIHKLSGGEKRRLALLKVLLRAPNVLLLDEVTNDLDIATMSVLETYLDEFTGAVLVASHDRYFLDRVVDHVFVLQGDGKVTRYLGNYSDHVEHLRLSAPVATKQMEKTTDRKMSRITNLPQKTRLTFQEERDYAVIEEQISQVENDLEDLAHALQTAGNDVITVQSLFDLQQEKQAQLDKLLDRWLYLSEKVEQIKQEQR